MDASRGFLANRQVGGWGSQPHRKMWSKAGRSQHSSQVRHLLAGAWVQPTEQGVGQSCLGCSGLALSQSTTNWGNWFL